LSTKTEEFSSGLSLWNKEGRARVRELRLGREEEERGAHCFRLGSQEARLEISSVWPLKTPSS